jgi:outer membrane protein OmpA-like peptidoglycan-associated protein
MFPTKSILLTGAALVASALVQIAQPSGAWAQSVPGTIILAQQEPGKPGEPQKPGQKKPEEHRPAGQNQPQNQPKPGQPPAAQGTPQPGHPPAAQGQPVQPQHPAAQGQPSQPQHPTAQEPLQQHAPAAQGQPSQPQHPTAQEQLHQPQAPTAQPNQKQGPAFGQQPGQPQTPTAQQPAQQQQPAVGQQPRQPQPPAAAQTQPQQVPATQTAHPAAPPPPPTQVRQTQEFLRPKGAQPTQGITSLRQERHEVQEGNRVVIQEPGRTIIRDGDRTIIRHNEVDRFTVGARSVQNEQRGNQTISVVVRVDGSRIQTITDADGRLVRRSRFDPGGREIVIVDNSWVTPQASLNFVVTLPAPVISIPRERYIVDVDRAGEADIYAAFIAPPVERLDRRYSLEEIRYSPMVRDRMPRVDLDTITFETGSWQLDPEQADKLAVIAHAMQRAIDRNPREVFLIEGHTDAVGNDVDNLSLSDRRAETVAVVLTEQFHVPAENLSTQGYGSQFLKIPSPGPERENRRVAVRRITPLLDPAAVGG